MSADELAGLCICGLIGIGMLLFARDVAQGYENLLKRARPWISWFAPYDEVDGLPLFWPWPKLIRTWGLQVWYMRVSGLMCLVVVTAVVLSR